MSLMPLLHGGSLAFAVNLPANDFKNTSADLPVYSGLKIDADGGLYEHNPDGTWSRFGTWLIIGTASGYYASRTVLSGSLDTDAGAGPLQLNTDREYNIQVSAPEETAQIQFDIASDVSGSPIVASRTYKFHGVFEPDA
jgi:hypothetical protein